MKCPYCQKSETKVLESRLLQEGFSVRRRRKCECCQQRFTTYETIEISMPMVAKNDSRREPYSRDKILSGIQKACQKRPITTAQLERVVNNIEKALLEISTKEVKSSDIGKIIIMYLKNLDPVAYVRFASVYQSFHDIDEFVKKLHIDEQVKDITRNKKIFNDLLDFQNENQ